MDEAYGNTQNLIAKSISFAKEYEHKNQRQRMTGMVVSLAHFLCPETRKRMAT
jgi:hypothetical protein